MELRGAKGSDGSALHVSNFLDCVKSRTGYQLP
jgi:hypothetical protein